MDREIVKEESMYDFYREQTLLLTEEYKELKERIDKAIENIENFICSEEYIKVDGIAIADNYKKQLNILKGEDK